MIGDGLGIGPQAVFGLPRLTRQRNEVVGVPYVGRIRRRFRVALPDQFTVDEAVADPDVREQPAETVAVLDVELQSHPATVYKTGIRVPRGLGVRLFGSRRIVALGGVDAGGTYTHDG